MKISTDMLFAHPVLSSKSTDFRDALFDADFEFTMTDNNLDIVASLTLKCPDLNSLLGSGGAGSGFFLICPSTYTNRLIEMAPGHKEHRFNASDFFGTVRLRPVVWSKEERKQWRSEYLNPEYGGSADFPAAALLAVGDEQPFSVDRERLRPFESIFRLAALDQLPPGEIAVDTDADKIIIQVHSQTKESIEGIRNNRVGRSILLNAVYLPAVMQVLNDIASDRSHCENRQWFRVFEAKSVARGIDLDRPEFLRDAQRLLDLPFRAVEAEKERLFA